uniref:Methyltransferase domain-containing protein n=1 Tax=Craspedostauros australis TaxID=1486917 RepID=A0A7R9WM31_9STRA|mmetsp:Transcript_11594/g.32005  ORF Transcript_11594/g.32005 Transcript_11594/m.32005 type:complete len:381 (+) Transcript_11594:1-1143(+)
MSAHALSSHHPTRPRSSSIVQPMRMRSQVRVQPAIGNRLRILIGLSTLSCVVAMSRPSSSAPVGSSGLSQAPSQPQSQLAYPSFDSRPTLSRANARDVYDSFAVHQHETAGKDAASGYGGPAITALLQMADMDHATNVLEFGCGSGKLAELVLSRRQEDANGSSYGDASSERLSSKQPIHWKGIDQSPEMIKGFQERCVDVFGADVCSVEYLEGGDPSQMLSLVQDRKLKPQKQQQKVTDAASSMQLDDSYDRFVSTYCLDLLCEQDMYQVLDIAKATLHPERGILLLAGITWGYRRWSIQTFVMTLVWEILYRFHRKRVGGCRPQNLRPYLEAHGWEILQCVETMPDGYPWMVSEVIAARPIQTPQVTTAGQGGQKKMQ